MSLSSRDCELMAGARELLSSRTTGILAVPAGEEGESGPVIEQKKAAAMIRNGSQLSAGHQLGTGGLPVAGSGQSNPPKGRWLFNTEHFSVL